jgi:5-methylcytosine-specific restriction endonuclease McrA
MQHGIDLPKSRSEAKAVGAKQYFTSIPCKHGHIAKRQTVNGTCAVCCYEVAKRDRSRNPEKWRQKDNKRMRAWRIKNPELSREMNRKHNSKYVIEWRKENKIKVRSYRQNYRARSNSAEGAFTANDIARIFRQQNGKCAYYRSCNNKLGKKYHIDHIIALINGGTNFPSNIQLTCPKCNHRKNDRQPDVYSRELGLLL